MRRVLSAVMAVQIGRFIWPVTTAPNCQCPDCVEFTRYAAVWQIDLS